MSGERAEFTVRMRGAFWPTSVPRQSDVDAVRGLLDMMETFPDNDQRARYLLSCNWMVEEGAAASAHAARGLDEIRAHRRRPNPTDEQWQAYADAMNEGREES